MSPKPKFAGISSALAVLVIAFSSAAASAADRGQADELQPPLERVRRGRHRAGQGGSRRESSRARVPEGLRGVPRRKGRPLRENLEKWGVGPADYLEMVPFLDGSGQRLCRWGKVDLAAAPGVPRVFVCGPFAATQLREPRMAEALVIHEMLHTLGLGENPPTSAEITSRVMGRCQ